MSKRTACLFGAAFILSGSGSAFAADIAVKAAAPSPAPVYNWTGWYAGVNAGASFGIVKTDVNGAPIFWTQPGVSGQITPGFGFSDQTYPAAFIGGGQIGYNWQYSPLIVAGLEADFQGSGERDGGTNFSQFNFLGTGACGVPTGVSTSPCTSNTSYTTQLDWFGTVRARIGYLFGDGAVLTYVTGGLAYGEVKINGTNTVSGTFSIPGTGSFSPFSLTQAFDHSNVNTGWVVGSGTEGKLLIPGWTYKIEGLYMDLGHLDATSVRSGASVANAPSLTNFLQGGQVTTHSHFTDTILRLGVNYQFH